ncbi:MAG: DUF2784 domain-containing protein [Spirochaetes bacterium]|nr:DUF2784 domain-containing protein [Spirochaetota bacterium]
MKVLYRISADLLVFLHFIWIIFMLWGFGKTVIALLSKNKGFLYNITVRTVHLAGILFVAFFILIDRPCPVTIWEINLRVFSGISSYTGSFIIHYLEKLVYPEVPAWVVNIPSVIIGAASFFLYLIFPPFKRRR